MKKPISLWYLMVFLSIFLVTSCDISQKNKLTRDKAKEIIIKEIFEGKNNLSAIGLLKIGQLTRLSNDELHSLKKLADIKFLNMQVSPYDKDFYDIFLIIFADYSIYQKKEGYDPMDLRKSIKKLNALVILGKLTFNDVTGIRLMQENKVALVDFNYQFTDLTPFGIHWHEGLSGGSVMSSSKELIKECLPIKNNDVKIDFDYKKKAPDLQQAIVKMELFDDGWRIAKRKNSQ